MKKTASSVLLILVAFLAGAACAQFGERAGVSIGVEYRSKTMDLQTSRFSPPFARLDDELAAMTVEQKYELPLISVGLTFMNYVEVRFLFGTIDFDQDLDSETEALSHAFTSDSEQVFGFVTKVMLPFSDKFLVGLQFTHLRGDLEDIKFNSAVPAFSFDIPEIGVTIPIDDVTPESAIYHETTVTPIVSATFGKLTPYAGPRYTRATTELDLTYLILGDDLERTVKYENKENWSFVVGAIFAVSDNLLVKGEIETLENESYTLSVLYSF